MNILRVGNDWYVVGYYSNDYLDRRYVEQSKHVDWAGKDRDKTVMTLLEKSQDVIDQLIEKLISKTENNEMTWLFSDGLYSYTSKGNRAYMIGRDSEKTNQYSLFVDNEGIVSSKDRPGISTLYSVAEKQRNNNEKLVKDENWKKYLDDLG